MWSGALLFTHSIGKKSPKSARTITKTRLIGHCWRYICCALVVYVLRLCDHRRIARSAYHSEFGCLRRRLCEWGCSFLHSSVFVGSALLVWNLVYEKIAYYSWGIWSKTRMYYGEHNTLSMVSLIALWDSIMYNNSSLPFFVCAAHSGCYVLCFKLLRHGLICVEYAGGIDHHTQLVRPATYSPSFSNKGICSQTTSGSWDEVHDGRWWW